MPAPQKNKLEIVRGDITTLAVDAIVNAANSHLQHGGGVALAIARKAGPVLIRQSQEIIARQGPVPTGAAVITDGGNLPARYVIHTVGPIWREHTPDEADRLLRQCVRSCLDLARERGLKSVAFPAISTGIYGFPVERAAPLLLREAANNLTGFDRVIFCLYDDPTYQLFLQTAQSLELLP
ncbi:MAG: macro domain-containing protein [Verrucomicrobiae bacterium]|nr:macro domain-containing protein [Verrucomicrobiae bacterium]